jgi:hypothetical protein
MSVSAMKRQRIAERDQLLVELVAANRKVAAGTGDRVFWKERKRELEGQLFPLTEAIRHPPAKAPALAVAPKSIRPSPSIAFRRPAPEGPLCEFCGGPAPCSNADPDWPHPPKETT